MLHHDEVLNTLQKALARRYSKPPSAKAKRYVGQFFDRTRVGTKITAKLEGNHGVYTVSFELAGQGLSAACSCHIGAGGSCHHCEALAATFLQDASGFKEVKATQLDEVKDLDDLHRYLKGVTLGSLLDELKAQGITQSAFAKSVGMNPRHLSAIKASELRNRYHNELGVTKVACLWALENIKGTRAK
jgi:uncharacterized Zn finger protein